MATPENQTVPTASPVSTTSAAQNASGETAGKGNQLPTPASTDATTSPNHAPQLLKMPVISAPEVPAAIPVAQPAIPVAQVAKPEIPVPTTLVPTAVPATMTEEQAAKVIQDNVRKVLTRTGTAGSAGGPTLPNVGPPASAVNPNATQKRVPGAFPGTESFSAPNPNGEAEGLDLWEKENRPEATDTPWNLVKDPSWWPGFLGPYQLYRPSMIMAATSSALFVLGYFRKSYAWVAVVSVFAIPMYLREMRMLAGLRDRYFASAARTQLEAKGLTWPLEKYLGPLPIFRRTTVFLLGSQATFIIGALNLSYAWCLIVIIATVPVWAREARLETLRIKYHTQEAIRVERMSEGMTESAEWLNFALDRYWQQFEPFLSSKIIDTLNESLRKYKPAILHSIEIVECTLGTRSPRIMDFQTSSRGEHSVMKLQTGISFVPPTIADMADYVQAQATETASVLPKPMVPEQGTAKPSPFPPRPTPKPCRIILAVRVGRGSLKIPIMIELTNVIIEDFGLAVTVTLNSQFPHLQSVNIAVPEGGRKRTVDFSLRPMMALDLISIPGLHDAIENAIDNAINGVLGKVDPTTQVRGLTIQIAKKPEAKTEDAPEQATGVLRCRLISGMNLRERGDYRGVVKLGGNVLMVTNMVSDQGHPMWNYVLDIPITGMTFANQSGFPLTDELVVEVQDTGIAVVTAKPMRTKPLHVRRWLDAAKNIPIELDTEDAIASLPVGSEDRKILEAWGLPIRPDIMSKRLYDPSNTLGLAGKSVSDSMLPQIQLVLRYFSIKDIGPDAKPTYQIPDGRQGLLSVTIHQALNLKDSTSFIPAFDQDSDASMRASSNGAISVIGRGVTGAVKGAVNVVSAGANSMTSLVTGTFEPFVTVCDAEWDPKKPGWKEGQERYETPSVLSASGNPVWGAKTQFLVDDADNHYLMFKVASRMDIGDTSIPVGYCVVHLKEALAAATDYSGSWWPIASEARGKVSGRMRIQFDFAPLKLPSKFFGNMAQAAEIRGSDLHLYPDYDFRTAAAAADGTAPVFAQNDGTTDDSAKFMEKPVDATFDLAKNFATSVASAPLAFTGKVTEEVKSTFGKLDNFFHTRKSTDGHIESPVLAQVETSSPLTPSKSKAQLIQELLPPGELNFRITECMNLSPLDDGAPVSTYIKMYGTDSHMVLKTDTVKKSLEPQYKDSQLIMTLKEGEAPVHTVVVYHEKMFGKDIELGVCNFDFRQLYQDYVLKKGDKHNPLKSAITIFETVLEFTKPADPGKGSKTGATVRFNVTFKRL